MYVWYAQHLVLLSFADFSVPSCLLTSSLHSGYRLCQVASSSSKWNILFWCHYTSGAVTKRYTADDRVWESLLMFEMEYKKAGIIRGKSMILHWTMRCWSKEGHYSHVLSFTCIFSHLCLRCTWLSSSFLSYVLMSLVGCCCVCV